MMAPAGTDAAAPATISFATALHRVRSLRQHAAVLAHLHELVITSFLAEGGPGNQPEFIAMLGREEVAVAEDIVDKVLLFLSEEIDRIRAEQVGIESGGVAVSLATPPCEESVVNVDRVAADDEVVVNPAAARGRPQKKK